MKLSPRELCPFGVSAAQPGPGAEPGAAARQGVGIDFEGDDRAVDVRIRSLRAALGEAGGQIKTVFKTGYRLEEG